MLGDEYSDALNIAFRFLATRARSEAEIKEKLYKKDFSMELVQKVIDRLKELEYIDDKEFAVSWIRQRLRLHPRGSYLLEQELLAKGISRELIEEALTDELPYEKEVEFCRELAIKKWQLILQSNRKNPRQKLVNLLRTKGYSWECIQEACGDYLFVDQKV